MNHSRPVLVALLPCVLALRTWAQVLYQDVRPIETPRTWTVDDSGGANFANLQAAVDAARAGDVLLVAAGVYGGFDLRHKGLTVLGDGAVPRIEGSVSVIDLPAGEEVVLRSLEIRRNGSDVRLEDNAGTVWIENCTFFGQGQFDPEYVSTVDCAAVVVMRTTVFGGDSLFYNSVVQPRAFHAVRSEIHAFESGFQGHDLNAFLPPSLGAAGGMGVRLQDSFLYAAGCLFQGGRGTSAICIGSMCADGAAPGGSGLNSVSAGMTPIALACTFTGGPGGAGGTCPGCGTGPAGPPTQGPVTTIPLPLRSYELETPVRSGTSYQLEAHCQPGELLWSVFSETLAHVYVPSFFGTRVGAFPVTLVFEGVADGSGSLVKSVPVPPLAGLTSFERLFAQGLFFDEFNNAYLGSPSVLVVVN